MKKTLLTGTLALSMMLGTTGAALAADVEPLMAEVVSTPAGSINVAYDKLSTEATSVFTITDKDVDLDAEKTLKIGELQAYTVETYQAEIDQTQESLAQAVESGQTTADEAAKILAQMADNLQQIKDGTLIMYYAQMENADGTPAGTINIVSVAEGITDAQFSDVTFTVNTH